MKLEVIIISFILISAGAASAKGRGHGHGQNGAGCGQGCGQDCSPGSAQGCGIAEVSATDAKLSEAEANHLLYMREEEKLARDVYLALGEKYNQRVFENIPRAEQFHMDAVLRLLEAYGLKDSAAAEPGRFNNPVLQKLYDDLVKRGSASRQEAFKVGALVEEVDILDLRKAISETENQDIISILQSLEGGSQRHLNAFVRNYESASGQSYVAQKMAQADVDSILGR